MGTPKFAKSAAFPQSKAYFTAAGTLWKLDVRQWAYATVDASDVDFDLKIGSNNPTVVPGFFDTTIKKITSTTTAGNGASVRFYANLPGFTYVNFFRPPSFDAVGPLLQVHVLERRSANAQDTQLTKLNGKTFAINAPDAVTYSMDKNVTSAAAEATPA